MKQLSVSKPDVAMSAITIDKNHCKNHNMKKCEISPELNDCAKIKLKWANSLVFLAWNTLSDSCLIIEKSGALLKENCVCLASFIWEHWQYFRPNLFKYNKVVLIGFCLAHLILSSLQSLRCLLFAIIGSIILTELYLLTFLTNIRPQKLSSKLQV